MTAIFVIIALIFLFRFLKPILLPILLIGFKTIFFLVVVFGVLAFLFLR
jgi:hypothetical protein